MCRIPRFRDKALFFCSVHCAMNIRIFIYDDSKDRRESLKALIALTKDMEVMGEGHNCKHVLADIQKFAPDVVLMDINRPNIDGIAGLRTIKENTPEIRVLMQTAFDDSDKIFMSIKNGARSYILKRDSPDRIIQAIQEVHEGGAAINPAIAQKALEYFKPAQKASLSFREEEVLKLLANGISYKMVASQLDLSYSTVNTHTNRIYEKLHVSSLGEAIAYFYKHIDK